MPHIDISSSISRSETISCTNIASKFGILWFIPLNMTKNLDLNGLQSIADNYDLFYIDLWGVIHNGINLHEQAIGTLKELLKKKKMFVLLTNAPRPNKTVQNFLEKMGMDKVLRDQVFTSGEAALLSLIHI